MIRSYKISVLLLSILFASFIIGHDVQAAERISGDNRYSTAVEISQAGWASSETVVIARGDSFPDALAGGPLAYHYNAPILLTPQTSLHAATKKELQHLGVKKVIILGGTAAVSKSVEDSLKNLGVTVDRIAGENRYDTAALIAKRLPSTKAIVANGTNFPDALAVAPYAARNGIPILLTNQSKLASETVNALVNRTSTIIVGGENAVSLEVARKLPKATRYHGKDRYETAHEIMTKLPMPNKAAYVATGRQFADALAGSVLAAKQNSSIVLTNTTDVPSSVRKTVNTLGFNTLIPFGGENAISAQAAYELSMLTLVDGNVEKVTKNEWDVFMNVNKEREKQGIRALRLHVQLSEVARIKSKDMHDNQYFSHTSPIFGSPFEMMTAHGILYRLAGENIAAGQTDAASVMNGWMNSPGHRANILKTDFTHIGVGHHNGNKGYRQYWTQMFITPRN
ncbi:cell wall-binding repeat-containing protein [Sutcliffiella deserti]|uniref:cell wall-binding repeat-containing protein n=1 Tax=Sutcliffiella deserti TaxID=2875501 RepID=UPI001CBB52D6|nr:cell wall-binding repeat-containing protein [Sutcliffiella deserti]